MKHIRQYFFAGLLFWIPIWATFIIIEFIIEMMDGTLSLLPEQYRPEHLFGMKIPGLGFLLSIIIVLVTGVLVTNFLGRKLVSLWEAILERIPFVRGIYKSVKQVMEALFSSQGEAFRKVVLVEYPRKDMWTIAFQTSSNDSITRDKFNRELVTLFVPTTPNPTAGYLVMVAKEDVIELSISSDEALKTIISLGVVKPSQTKIG